MPPIFYILPIVLGVCLLFACEGVAQSRSQAWNPQANWGPDINTQLRLTYVPRNLSRPGDFKVVVVPATNPRQARLDAQTYHLGWDAIEARVGQSRVMYEVLLRKRPERAPSARIGR